MKVLEIGPRKVVVEGTGKLVQEKGEHKKTEKKKIKCLMCKVGN